MTNQSREDELGQHLLNDKAFQYILKFAPESQRELMTFELARYINALIRTEKLNLLAEAREQVIGKDCSDEVSGGSCFDCEMDSGYYANVHNELKDEQRTALTKMEAEL